MQLLRERFSFRFENFFEAYSQMPYRREKIFKAGRKSFSKETIPYPKFALNKMTMFYLLEPIGRLFIAHSDHRGGVGKKNINESPERQPRAIDS